MMSFSLSGGVEVYGFISPTDIIDTYPVIDPLYGIDGFRNVNNISELNAIPTPRRRSGMVVGIFNDTILNNIKLGKLNATHSEVVEVSKKVNVDSFVTNLELGYDTVLGENGIALSGGQSQRISIARALLKDSPILLLDEATSALDTINETEIQKSFQEFFELKTVIVIAHRLSTVLYSDNILVMKDGQLIDQGCHDDLIKRNAYYKKLTKMHLKD